MKRLTMLLVVLLLGAAVPARAQRAAAGVPTVFVQPGAHTAPVVSLIHQAKHSLRLEVYLLTNHTVVDALAAAVKRGVDVRVLLEQHPYGLTRYATSGFDLLQKAGVPVRWANEAAFTYSHVKSMEIDGSTAGIFTFNFSSSGFFTNREFGVIDPRHKDAAALATIINADWSRKRPHYTDPSLVVSPYTSRADFTTLIDSAHHTLDLYAEEVNDASIENKLAQAAKRGVRVRLITSESTSAETSLQQRGVQVHIMKSPYVHAKTIVADGKRMYVGSENISATSLDKNREVGILLYKPAQIKVVEDTFTSDWAGTSSGTPPPTPPAGGHAFPVKVTVSPSHAPLGQTLTISATTRAGASCTVKVTYADGIVSRARSLGTRETASPAGKVSWSFTQGSKVPGLSHVAVTCTSGSASTTGTGTFTITG